MEKEIIYEKVGGIVAIGLVALAVNYCSLPPATEAFTTPFGAVYLNGSENNPKIVKHEEEHWKQFMEDGVVFWWRYNTDPAYACRAEIRANEAAGMFPSDNHIRCVGVDLE